MSLRKCEPLALSRSRFKITLRNKYPVAVNCLASFVSGKAFQKMCHYSNLTPPRFHDISINVNCFCYLLWSCQLSRLQKYHMLLFFSFLWQQFSSASKLKCWLVILQARNESKLSRCEQAGTGIPDKYVQIIFLLLSREFPAREKVAWQMISRQLWQKKAKALVTWASQMT